MGGGGGMTQREEAMTGGGGGEGVGNHVCSEALASLLSERL